MQKKKNPEGSGFIRFLQLVEFRTQEEFKKKIVFGASFERIIIYESRN